MFVAASVDGVDAGDWPWWLLAFAAQLGLDGLVWNGGRVAAGGPVAAAARARAGVVAFVDAALAPIGLLAAAVAADEPLAVLAVLPLAR